MAGVPSSSQTPNPTYYSPAGESEELLIDKLFDQLQQRARQDYNIHKHLVDQNSLLKQLLTDVRDMKLKEAETDYTAITDELRRTNLEVLNSIIGMAEALNSLSKEVDEMKAEIDLLKEESRDQTKYIKSLEKEKSSHPDQNRSPRSSVIEMHQIKPEKNETSTSLIQKVCDVGASIGVQTSEADLRDVYRQEQILPSHGPGPIVVEFVTVQKMQTFWKGLIASRFKSDFKEATFDFDACD